MKWSLINVSQIGRKWVPRIENVCITVVHAGRSQQQARRLLSAMGVVIMAIVIFHGRDLLLRLRTWNVCVVEAAVRGGLSLSVFGVLQCAW